ncbi:MULTISPECIES: hypothetical protein [unclassified Streptomyces]|uniref:hypothetical protein n=1 Tax=Streptomyces sp. NPDC005955 TaxID=3364738 RepID=UPI0036952683
MHMPRLVTRALTVAGVGLAAAALAAPHAVAGTTHPNVSWYDGTFTGTSVVVNPTNVKSYGKLRDLANLPGGTALWVNINTTTGNYNREVGRVSSGGSRTGHWDQLPFGGRFLNGKITLCSSTGGGGCGTPVSIR